MKSGAESAELGSIKILWTSLIADLWKARSSEGASCVGLRALTHEPNDDGSHLGMPSAMVGGPLLSRRRAISNTDPTFVPGNVGFYGRAATQGTAVGDRTADVKDAAVDAGEHMAGVARKKFTTMAPRPSIRRRACTGRPRRSSRTRPPPASPDPARFRQAAPENR
jgi:hypothetical protein